RERWPRERWPRERQTRERLPQGPPGLSRCSPPPPPNRPGPTPGCLALRLAQPSWPKTPPNPPPARPSLPPERPNPPPGPPAPPTASPGAWVTEPIEDPPVPGVAAGADGFCAAAAGRAKTTERIKASMKTAARPPQAHRHARRDQAASFDSPTRERMGTLPS